MPSMKSPTVVLGFAVALGLSTTTPAPGAARSAEGFAAAVGTSFPVYDVVGSYPYTAVAHNSVQDEFLVVFVVSGSGRQLLGQRLDAATGARVGTSPFAISDTYSSADNPGVAYDPSRNEYFVVWDGQPAGGELEIYGRRVDGATGAAIGAGDLRISAMGPNGNGAFLARDPTVVHNPLADEYLVVWYGDDDRGVLAYQEYEIFGQRIDAISGSETGSDDFRISSFGNDGDINFKARFPAVAYNTSDDEYLVIWGGTDYTTNVLFGDSAIYGQRLAGADASEIGADDFGISAAPPTNRNGARHPTVVYRAGGNQYLAAWSSDRTGVFAVEGRRLDAAGTPMSADDFPISNRARGSSEFPSLLYNDASDEYLATWASPFPTEIYGQRLRAATGANVGRVDFAISDMQTNNGWGTLAPGAYSSDSDTYLVVWEGRIPQSFPGTLTGALISGPLSDFVLDGFGALHAGGGAVAPTPETPYFGFDIARDVELYSPGHYVLDGWGGVHLGGGAPLMSPAPPYFGWDIARDLEIVYEDNAARRPLGCYVLDGLGVVYTCGGAPSPAPVTPYFGFDAAEDLELAAVGYYVLDSWGGVFPGGGAAAITPATPYFGFDIARDLELSAAGYYVLDGFGGIHTGGGAPPIVQDTPYLGWDFAEDLELASTGYYVLDAAGGVTAGGGAPPMNPATFYFGWDIARDLELQ